MFRLLAFIGLLLTAGWLATALKARSVSFAETGQRFKQAGQNIILSLAQIKTISSRDFTNKLLLPLAVYCVLILALTGFIPVVFFDAHMSGYLLMLHVAISPVFALVVATLAVLWAQNHKFDGRDWMTLKALFGAASSGAEKRAFFLKLSFWGMVVFSWLAVVSIVSSMYKIFGTHGQEILLNTHRYTTLTLFIFLVVYIFLGKFDRRADETNN